MFYLQVYLTPSQIKKYNESGELILSKGIFSKTANFSLCLSSENEVKEIKKIKNSTKKLAIKHTNSNLSGGFLPILPLLGGIAALTTIGKNIYDAVENKKVNDQLKKSILAQQNLQGKAISLSGKVINEKKIIK